MGDKIVLMNHGVVEQFGVPQNIYDWPATKFVAEFIGSPPMNFLDFHGMAGVGETTVSFGGTAFDIPRLIEGENGTLTFGVRPEHIRLDDSAAYRGAVTAVEYLGTTQIITLNTANGAVKVRAASSQAAKVGEMTGLSFDPRTVTIFDAETGRALKSEANAGVHANG